MSNTDQLVQRLLGACEPAALSKAGTGLVLEHLTARAQDNGAVVWQDLLNTHDLTGTDLAAAAAQSSHHQVRARVWAEGLMPETEALAALENEPSQVVRAAIIGSFHIPEDIATAALTDINKAAVSELLEARPALKDPSRVPAAVWASCTSQPILGSLSPSLRDTLRKLIESHGPAARAVAADSTVPTTARLWALKHADVSAEQACAVLDDLLSVKEPHPVTGLVNDVPAMEVLEYRTPLFHLTDRPVLTVAECDRIVRAAAFVLAGTDTQEKFITEIEARKVVPWSSAERRSIVAECANEDALLSLLDSWPVEAFDTTDDKTTFVASPFAGPRTIRALSDKSGTPASHLVGSWADKARLWEDVDLAMSFLASPTRREMALRSLVTSGYVHTFTADVASGAVALPARLWSEPIAWAGDLDALTRRLPLSVVIAGSVGDSGLAGHLLNTLGTFLAKFGARELFETINPGDAAHLTLGEFMDAHAAAAGTHQ